MNLTDKSADRLARETAPWPAFAKPSARQARLPEDSARQALPSQSEIEEWWSRVSQQLDRAVAAAGRAQVFRGMIMAWRRPLAEIPEGWQLCDGTNGTVDLRDSFIKCVAEGEEPDGATARGAAEHTPEGTVSQPTFTGTAGETGERSAGKPEGAFTGDEIETSEDTAGTPAGEISADTAGTPAGTLSSSGAHTHSFTQGSNAATPDLVAADTSGAGVAASGTTGSDGAHTHTFAGDELATHTHTFTGEELAPHSHTLTPTGAIAIERLPAHNHDFRPAGEVSQPEFSGRAANFEPRHYKLAFIEKL